MTLRVLFTALLWSLASSASPAPADSTDDLLRRMAEVYGGKGAPAAVRQTGRTESFMRGRGPVERAYRHPEQFRIEIRYPGQTEIRILAGRSAWQQDRPAQPTFRAALMLQAARFALPWNLIERRQALLDRGSIVVGKHTLRLLELPLADGLRLTAEVDPDSARILRSRGQYEADGKVVEFSTAYDDFVVHAGRLFATTEHHYAMGQYIGRTQLDRIEVLDDLPPALFLPASP